MRFLEVGNISPPCFSSSTHPDSVLLLVVSTLQGAQGQVLRYFHFDSFLISSLIMFCSVPHMITSLIKQWFSPSFSPHNNKSQRPYENTTITKGCGDKIPGSAGEVHPKKKRRNICKIRERERERSWLSVTWQKERRGFNNSEQSRSLQQVKPLITKHDRRPRPPNITSATLIQIIQSKWSV